MTPCKASPADGEHKWRPVGHETADGSTLLTCLNGCGEVAYRLRVPTVPRRRGVPIR